MVVDEVRQGTLGGREHWAWMVVVEVRQGTLGVVGRGEDDEEKEEKQAIKIKSNNPHLAGGEKCHENPLENMFCFSHETKGFSQLL